jgi:hypothetical protein
MSERRTRRTTPLGHPYSGRTMKELRDADLDAFLANLSVKGR